MIEVKLDESELADVENLGQLFWRWAGETLGVEVPDLTSKHKLGVLYLHGHPIQGERKAEGKFRIYINQDFTFIKEGEYIKPVPKGAIT